MLGRELATASAAQAQSGQVHDLERVNIQIRCDDGKVQPDRGIEVARRVVTAAHEEPRPPHQTGPACVAPSQRNRSGQRRLVHQTAASGAAYRSSSALTWVMA